MNFGRFFGHFQMYSKSRLLTLRTWSLARNIWGNTNERKVKRNKIVSELKKGFIPDLKEIKENGGKRYNALEKPFPKEESITLPTITGVTLSGESLELPKDIIGFVVLILLWTRDHGQRACDTYRSVFQKNFHTSDVRCYEVNLLDRWIFKMMKSYIITNLQKQLPLDRQQKFLCCYDGAAEVVDAIFENTLVGHAVLIDSKGRIRWKAHGPPTEKELTYLVDCTRTLRLE